MVHLHQHCEWAGIQLYHLAFMMEPVLHPGFRCPGNLSPLESSQHRSGGFYRRVSHPCQQEAPVHSPRCLCISQAVQKILMKTQGGTKTKVNPIKTGAAFLCVSLLILSSITLISSVDELIAPESSPWLIPICLCL